MEAAELAHLRRARDLLDREYARPLDVPVMARAALMSPSLFARRFREAYGDTPYGYLQAQTRGTGDGAVAPRPHVRD